jgi:hypothetical protein
MAWRFYLLGPPEGGAPTWHSVAWSREGSPHHFMASLCRHRGKCNSDGERVNRRPALVRHQPAALSEGRVAPAPVAAKAASFARDSARKEGPAGTFPAHLLKHPTVLSPSAGEIPAGGEAGECTGRLRTSDEEVENDASSTRAPVYNRADDRHDPPGRRDGDGWQRRSNPCTA